MFWAPIFGTSEGVVFPSLFAYPDLLFLARVLNLAAFAVFMLAGALFGERLHPLIRRGPFVPIAVLIGCIGIFAGCAAGMGWVAPWMLLPGAVARGYCAGATTMLWVGLFIHADNRIVGASVAGALTLYAAYGIPVVLIVGAAPVASTVLLTVAPALSYLGCRLLEKSEIRNQPVDQEEMPAPPKTRGMLYAANFVFGLMLGGLLHFFSMEDTALYMAAFLLMSALCLGVFVAFGEKADLRLVFRAFMLCYASTALLLILLGLSDNTLILAIASAALSIILLYVVIIFLDTQARFRKPYWRVPGLTQVFAPLGMIASSCMLHATRPWEFANGLSLLLLASTCLIFIAGVFLSTGGFSSRPWGFSSLVPMESAEMRRMRRCGQLAAEHKLTTRELEILQLLASGSTRESIAEALVISPATAKTHVRNIYAKLGVHSRHDLEEKLGR